ncbi:hypothetical protein BV20DRAFT_113009 [Pilatotrama ljubarskyi]|nr:hypothetical protein BV20DRAFT_113009 [Pilatotrama ljubarskyi]
MQLIESKNESLEQYCNGLRPGQVRNYLKRHMRTTYGLFHVTIGVVGMRRPYYPYLSMTIRAHPPSEPMAHKNSMHHHTTPRFSSRVPFPSSRLLDVLAMVRQFCEWTSMAKGSEASPGPYVADRFRTHHLYDVGAVHAPNVCYIRFRALHALPNLTRCTLTRHRRT